MTLDEARREYARMTPLQCAGVDIRLYWETQASPSDAEACLIRAVQGELQGDPLPGSTPTRT